MPDNKDTKQNLNIFRRMAERIQNGMDDLYKSTYYSDTSNKDQLNGIKNDINTSIKNIMDLNSDNTGEPNISIYG